MSKEGNEAEGGTATATRPRRTREEVLENRKQVGRLTVTEVETKTEYDVAASKAKVIEDQFIRGESDEAALGEAYDALNAARRTWCVTARQLRQLKTGK